MNVARSLRAYGWQAAGLALAVPLVLPWFYGTSDGDSLIIGGLATEPGFAVAMVACAAGVAFSGSRLYIAALCATTAIGLTLWMLPRGDRYSGYDHGPGGYLELAVAVVVLAAAVWLQLQRWRARHVEP